MIRPQGGQPGSWAGLVILAMAAGCASTPGWRPAGDDHPEPGTLLRSAALEAVSVRLVQEARSAGQEGRLPVGDPPLVVPPFVTDSRAADGSALTWAVVRRIPELRPVLPRGRPTSIPALLTWVRQQSPPGPVVWAVEIHPTGPTAQLVVVSRGGTWRSREQRLPVVALEAPWPLSVPAEPGVGSMVVEGGETLRRLQGAVWLESRDGRRDVRPRRSGLALGDLRPWERWDRTWVDRIQGRPEDVATLGSMAGDARLELRFEETPAGQGQRWWIARGGAAMPLPLSLGLETRIVSLAPAPEVGSSLPAWMALLRTPFGRSWVEVLTARLRWIPPARALPTRSGRARRERARARSEGMIVQAGSPPPDPPWPRDRWGLWRRVHEGVNLASWEGRHALPEPLARFVSENADRTWRVHLSLPGPRGPWPGVQPGDVGRALRARLDASIAAPWYDWLLEPLRSVRIETGPAELRLRFDAPVPDLVERLAHPVLALADDPLAARYATHRRGGDRLVPRHPGGVELVVERDSLGDSPAGYLVAGREVLRPHRHSLDLRGDEDGGLGGWTTLLAEGGPLRADREPPVDVVLFCAPDSPGELRLRLARALSGVTTPDLLALTDTSLAARAPASGVAWPGADFAPSDAVEGDDEFALVLLEVDPAEDPNGEMARAGRRLRHLLAPVGIVVGHVDSPAVAGFSAQRRIVARIQRLSLYSGEVLLRVLELASWVDGGVVAEPLQEAQRLAVDNPRRTAAALSAETRLLSEGLVIPLWREPGLVLLDRRIAGAGPVQPGLPLLMREARLLRPSEEGGGPP